MTPRQRANVLQYHRFDPTACDYPRPRVPVLPPLTLGQLAWRPRPLPRGLQHFACGRYALKAAYGLSGVGPGGALLAPAYHCRTMLDPAIRLGADVLLYSLTPELEPDLQALRSLATTSATPIKALLFTHYFGIARDIAPVAALCCELGISLIEDCSHALVLGPPATQSVGLAIGQTGHYAVSSPYKFLPCPDGGLLWSNGSALPAGLTRARRRKSELRGLHEVLDQVLRGRRSPDAQALDQQYAAASARLGTPAREWIGDAGSMSGEYVVAAEVATSLEVSRWVLRHVDIATVVDARRQRYLQWVEAVAGLPGCRALFADLPPGCVPYKFALQVQRPQDWFHTLKHLGLPIWRWDDMAVSDCVVSQQYRQGVFHLPCHQALRDGDMQWMIAALRRVAAGR